MDQNTPITGDATKGTSVKTVALTLPQPVVAKADLLDTAHPINQAAMSGKQAGSTVIVAETFELAVASGTKPADKWKVKGSDLA